MKIEELATENTEDAEDTKTKGRIGFVTSTSSVQAVRHGLFSEQAPVKALALSTEFPNGREFM